MSELENLVEVTEVLEQEEKNKRALLLLLDKEREKKDHLFALRCNMGMTRSYVASVALEWVAQKVKFASELPIFKEYKDPETGRIRLDEETASMIQQRAPDFSRQLPMSLYLAARPTHKFPPILVVVTQGWVDEPESDAWDSQGRSLRDSINSRPLDTSGAYVDLQITGDTDFIYAIDGQHRLMAIQGLKDLLSEGHLYQKDKDGRQKSKRFTIDDVIELSQGRLSRSTLQALLGERIGIELIPAVHKGETRKDALRRLRSIFVHVNKTAKPLTKGEIALLDEDNGFAVVARALATTHPLLQERVDLKKGQLAESSTNVTTLETLVSMATDYLSPLFDWRPELGAAEIPVRPDEEDIDRGFESMKLAIDALSSLPTLSEIMQGANPADYRQLESGPGHLLLRPIGQLALFKALAVLVHDRKMDLSELAKTLSRKDREGMFKCDDPATPWFGTVLDPSNKVMRRTQSAQNLAFKLFIHLLAGGTPDKTTRDVLREEFRSARVVDFERNMVKDFGGEIVSPEKLELPNPW